MLNRLVLRVPWPPHPEQPTLARREHRLLSLLATLELPFRIPRAIEEIEVDSGIALLQSLVGGWPLEMRPSRLAPAPWEIIAGLAASCHRIPSEPVRDVLPGGTTWQDHALEALQSLDAFSLPELSQAHALLLTHPPPERSAVLLHGDLLGQNIRIAPFGSYRPGLIDWSEARMGDPASDLAIVTQGVRRPFQTDSGREKLVAAYNRTASVSITTNQVRRYEMCMLADWIRAATANNSGDVEQFLNRFRRLLREMVKDEAW